jgi:folate-binding protein YgfZ
MTALRAEHESAGAVFEGATPGWYGGSREQAVAAEYAAAGRGAALAELGERGLLVASGPQCRKFLHNLLSNDVELPSGQGRRAALLDLKGHVQAVIRCSVTGASVALELGRDRIDATRATLEHYRVAAPVRFTSPETTVLGLLGPEAPKLLGSTGTLPESPEAHVEGTLSGVTVRVIRAGDLPRGGWAVHVPSEHAARVWSGLIGAGAVALGRRALDALRVEEGRAWFGPDIDTEHLLHETGLLAELHSATKGCYLGQEVVARLEGRGGHVNKQLRGLRLDRAADPGTPVEVNGAGVGQLTTSALSPELGAIALAYVHRNHFDPGTEVSVAGRSARVEALPLRSWSS